MGSMGDEMACFRSVARLGLSANDMTWPELAHGGTVVQVDRPLGRISECDGVITATANLPLVITVADCFPVIIYDAKHHVVALLHCGRGGVANKIIANAMAKMRDIGCDIGHLLVGVGPGICGHCYDISPSQTLGLDRSWLTPLESGRLLLDLPRAIADQLAACDVPSSRVNFSGICTTESPQLFSHHESRSKDQFACIVTLAKR
jgi:hypothetical protein